MSRSKRKPCHFICCGADPQGGKQHTSRWIRRVVNQLLHIQQEDFDFAHPLDNTRGHGGTRDADYGWDWFGDGKNMPHRTFDRYLKHLSDEDEARWVKKLCRK